MEECYNNLISQLDLLIGFLDVASEDVFQQIQDDRVNNNKQFGTIGDIYSYNFQAYKNHISVSAFLLGYAHFEAFLTDVVKIKLLEKPERMIPNRQKDVKQKTITYLQLINSNSKADLIQKLVEKEIRKILYKDIEEIIKYCENKLNLKWTNESKTMIPIANRIRNCLMHNNGKADLYLANYGEYINGKKIELTPSDSGYPVSSAYVTV